jgi:hypothetical protein
MILQTIGSCLEISGLIIVFLRKVIIADRFRIDMKAGYQKLQCSSEGSAGCD